MIDSADLSDTASSRIGFRFILVAIFMFLGILIILRDFTPVDASFRLFSLIGVSSKINVAPSKHDFRNVTTGSNASVKLEVRNEAASRLTANRTTLAGADRGEFNMDAGGAPFTLAPGASRIIEVSFNPALPLGAKTATLEIAGDDPDEFRFDVTLEGMAVDNRPPRSDITHEEIQVGGSTGIYTVTTATNVTAASGNLYLAAISTSPDVAVTSVSGLGLTWTLVKAQCSARNNITRLEVWMAQGITNGGAPVTATLSNRPSNAVIVVSRYSGVDKTTPVGHSVSGNTNGEDGACLDGTDNVVYSFDLSTAINGSIVYGAATMRNTENLPGAGYLERTEVAMGSGDQVASVATEDMLALTSTVSIGGRFSSRVDWAFVGLIVNPSRDGASPMPPPISERVDDKPIASGDVAPPTVKNSNTSDFAAAKVADAYPPKIPNVTSSNASTVPALPNTTGEVTSNKALDRGDASNSLTGETPSDVTSVLFEEIKSGGSSGLASVKTNADLTAVAGDLYLAAISTRMPVEVASITGLGLTWIPILTPRAQQCSGRNATNITVFMAQGLTTSDGSVTAYFADAPSNAVITVSRYSGASTTTPIGDIVSGNTNRMNGACSGGIDSAAYSFDLSTTASGSVVYGAVAMRNKIHMPTDSGSDRAELAQGIRGEVASVATRDMPALTSIVKMEGDFSSDVDWAFVGLVINPSRNSDKPVLSNKL